MNPTTVVSSANVMNRVVWVGGGAVVSVEGKVLQSVTIDRGLDYKGKGEMMPEKCWTSLRMNRKKPSSKMKQRSWHQPETQENIFILNVLLVAESSRQLCILFSIL